MWQFKDWHSFPFKRWSLTALPWSAGSRHFYEPNKVLSDSTVQLPRLGHKALYTVAASMPSLWAPHSVGSQLPCHEDPRAVPGKGTQARNGGLLQAAKWASHMGENPAAPAWPSEEDLPGYIVTGISWETEPQNSPQIPDQPQTINDCCFKPPHSGALVTQQ